MTGSKEDVLEESGAAGILPVLRTSDPSRLRDQVHRLRESGAKAVEPTTSIPEGEARLAEFTEAMPDMVWGMGAVTERAVAGSGVLLIEGGHAPGTSPRRVDNERRWNGDPVPGHG